MIHKIQALQRLFTVLQRIPHIAPRNLNKIANHFIALAPDQRELVAEVLLRLEQDLATCAVCCMLMQRSEACLFCGDDTTRNKQIICVVEQWYDVVSIEKTNGYTGLYHVLGGLISPLEGVSVEDISIELLCKRLASCKNVEVLFALSQTPEGEATSAYIEKRARELGATVSHIARGIPVGAALDTMDRLTIFKALSERRSL